MFADLYIKTVLTVIAIALSIMAINPWIAPPSIEAATTEEGITAAILSTLTRLQTVHAKTLSSLDPED